MMGKLQSVISGFRQRAKTAADVKFIHVQLNISYYLNSFALKFRGDKTNWLTAYHLYGSNVSQIDETLDFIAVVTDRSQPIQKTSMKVTNKAVKRGLSNLVLHESPKQSRIL